jgi:hypothetical protein
MNKEVFLDKRDSTKIKETFNGLTVRKNIIIKKGLWIDCQIT